MRALNSKLKRDLWRLRGQVIAVAIVIGSGVAVLVMSLSTLDALNDTTAAYYERYRFGEVFAAATRVPERVRGRIAAIDGVQSVQTRITRYAILDMAGFREPVIGRLTSIPENGQPILNRLALRSGRWISPDAPDEVIVNEPFAEAHGLEPGSHFSAIINSRKQQLQVVGIALSPEFVYALAPGALMADDERYGVIWMSREALAAAFDLDHAFNDMSLSLLRGAAPLPVIAEVDSLLERYGGISAIERADQQSHWFLMNEIDQIKTMSTVLPAIFLGVAAFLSHMVLSRLIAIERAEIGLLKAFGYSNVEIGWHYVKFVIVIALLGSVIGWILGGLFGRYNTEVYAGLFRFPLLIYRPSGLAFFIAVIVSCAATMFGALGAVRRAIELPPAEAMRPPQPATYRKSGFFSAGFDNSLDQPTRIALRQIRRWPMRAAFTCAGISMSVGLLIMALQWNDSIDYIAETYFFDAQHQSMTIGLADPEAKRVAAEFARLPGVMKVEPWRGVAADFAVGVRKHRGTIIGMQQGNRLRPIHDDRTAVDLPVPRDGIVLGTYLARKLGVEIGDEVRVEVLEGRRPVGAIPVAAVYETTIGMPALMDLDALNRWLKVGPEAEYFDLLVDPDAEPALFAELKRTPKISSVMLKQAAYREFYDTIGEHILVYIVIFTGFACALGFGVTYNSARIALSERGRELATLRVLGFTRREISYILLGEVALLVFVALPVGCLFGRWLTLVMARAFDTELFRMPFVIEPSTYGLAVIFAILAAVASAALVRRRVEHLDLIRVLKTRE